MIKITINSSEIDSIQYLEQLKYRQKQDHCNNTAAVRTFSIVAVELPIHATRCTIVIEKVPLKCLF